MDKLSELKTESVEDQRHRVRYEEAEALAAEDNHIKVMGISLRFLQELSLSLYRRALVNLRLAKSCEFREFPDKAKFARESKRTLDKVGQAVSKERREVLLAWESEGKKEQNILLEYHMQAQQALVQIQHEEAKDLAAQKIARYLGLPDIEWEELVGDKSRLVQIAKDGYDLLRCAGFILGRETPPLPREMRTGLDPWTIEGAYTTPAVKQEEESAEHKELSENKESLDKKTIYPTGEVLTSWLNRHRRQRLFQG